MIEVIDKPNQHVETQYYNKSKQLIAEIAASGFSEYRIDFFKMGSGGEYVKLMKSERVTNLGSAAVIARRYVEFGVVL